MVSAYSQIHITARERLIALSSKVRMLRGRKYPSPLSIKLLTTIEIALGEHLSRLDSELATPPKAPTDEGLQSIVSLQAQLCLTFANKVETDVLPLIDRANNTEAIAPWVLPISRVVSSLAPGVEVLFCGYPKRNYHTIPRMGSQYLKQTLLQAPAAAASVTTDFAVIEMCSDPPAGPLGQALVSHEIGHILSDAYGLVDKVAESLDKTDAWDRLVTDYSRDVPRLRSWIDELLCDFAAVYLFGPAYLFAAIAFSSVLLPLDGGDEEPPAHPPWPLRYLASVDALLEPEQPNFSTIKPLSLGNRTVDIAGLLRTWQTDSHDLNRLITNSRQEMLWRVVSEGFTEARRLARDVCSPCLFTPEIFDREVPLLCRRLLEALPPNEIESWDRESGAWSSLLPSLASVLNAGWAYFLCFGPTSARSNAWGAQELRRFDSLLTTAIEYVELRRSWSASSR